MILDLINRNQSLLEELFDDFKGISFAENYNNFMRTDIKEYKNHYILISELPGLKKEDIKISLEKRRLIIEAVTPKTNKEEEKPQEGFNYLRQERIQGIIRRSFLLNEDITMDDIKGNLKDGLLTIEINKKERKSQPKQYLKLE
jgi:HSP20 family protein